MLSQAIAVGGRPVQCVLSRKKLQGSGTGDCSDACYPEDLILASHDALVSHSGLPCTMFNYFLWEYAVDMHNLVICVPLLSPDFMMNK